MELGYDCNMAVLRSPGILIYLWSNMWAPTERERVLLQR